MPRQRDNEAANLEPKIDQAIPRDWAHLIRKLRWIGLEDDAKRLELAVGTLPPQERGELCGGPYSTD